MMFFFLLTIIKQKYKKAIKAFIPDIICCDFIYDIISIPITKLILCLINSFMILPNEVPLKQKLLILLNIGNFVLIF